MGNGASTEESFVNHLQPGDLIEYPHSSGGFSHWAVYAGEQYVIGSGLIPHSVIHVKVQVQSRSGFWSSASVVYSTSNVHGQMKDMRRSAIVKLEGIDKLPDFSVAKKNNFLDQTHNIRSQEKIVEIALGYVDVPFEFHAINNNCEHFVTFCRYGRPISRQADDYLRDHPVMSFREEPQHRPRFSQEEEFNFSEVLNSDRDSLNLRKEKRHFSFELENASQETVSRPLIKSKPPAILVKDLATKPKDRKKTVTLEVQLIESPDKQFSIQLQKNSLEPKLKPIPIINAKLNDDRIRSQCTEELNKDIQQKADIVCQELLSKHLTKKTVPTKESGVNDDKGYIDVSLHGNSHAEMLDREIRKKNVVVFGLPEKGSLNEDIIAVSNILSCLKLEDKIELRKHVEEIRRVGQKMSGKIRPLRLKMKSMEEKGILLQYARFLKGFDGYKQVYIKEDLTTLQRNEEKRNRGTPRYRSRKHRI